MRFVFLLGVLLALATTTAEAGFYPPQPLDPGAEWRPCVQSSWLPNPWVLTWPHKVIPICERQTQTPKPRLSGSR